MAGNKKRKKEDSTTFTIGGSVSTGGGDIAGGNISKRDVYHAKEINISSVDKLFQPVYEALDEPEKYPKEKREKLKKYVAEVQEEASKGKGKADKGFIENRLTNIAKMAPDILQVALKTIANPVIGLAELAEKIRQKASEKNKEDVKKNEIAG